VSPAPTTEGRLPAMGEREHDDGPPTEEFDVDAWLATLGQDEPITIDVWPNKRPGAA
jgi:hypothetical protein